MAALKLELQTLQAAYLAEVGPLYAELHQLEADLAEAEIRAGLRPPPDEPDAPGDAGGLPHASAEGCGNRTVPSVDLKRVFRDVAKAVHPDRARDDAARFRRHSLMAEANRAYAEQDADRLLLILRVWEGSADAVIGDDPVSQRLRRERRIAELGDHLVALDAELVELRQSAIARLKRRLDETRAQGWDLFAEMVRQVKREIVVARARLASMARPPLRG